MLTPNQENYLRTVPESKIAEIKPFDPRIPRIVEELIAEIHSVEPKLEVLFLGASALGISGQNDVDLYVLCPESEFEQHLPNLVKLFGNPKPGISIIQWNLIREGFDIELYLTDPATSGMKEQIKIFELLKNNERLKQEYQKLKESSDGLPYREYQKRKYEFYNLTLGIETSPTPKAGAIIVKNGSVLLLYRTKQDDWTFPKGHMETGENAHQTMIREIKEETRLDVKIIRELPKLEYTTSKGESVTVSMFLAEPIDQNQLLSQEHEGDRVEWVPITEVPQRLSYDNLRVYFVSMTKKGKIVGAR